MCLGKAVGKVRKTVYIKLKIAKVIKLKKQFNCKEMWHSVMSLRSFMFDRQWHPFNKDGTLTDTTGKHEYQWSEWSSHP